jgi:hypothetical protein
VKRLANKDTFGPTKRRYLLAGLGSGAGSAGKIALKKCTYRKWVLYKPVRRWEPVCGCWAAGRKKEIEMAFAANFDKSIGSNPHIGTYEQSAVFSHRTRLRGRISSKNTAQAVYLPQIDALQTVELEIRFQHKGKHQIALRTAC